MTALPDLFMTPAEPLMLSPSSRLATMRPNWNWPANDVMAVQILLPQRASALVALVANDLAKQTATIARSALVSALSMLSCITSHDDQD